MCTLITNRSSVLFIMLFILLNSVSFYVSAWDSAVASQSISQDNSSIKEKSLPSNNATLLIQEAALQNAKNENIYLNNKKKWSALLSILMIGILCTLFYIYKKYSSLKNTLQKTQEKLLIAEKSSEIKTDFVASFGHEIRTPINGILGMSELLLKSQLNETQYKHVKLIRRAAKHLSYIINDALDLARIEQNRLVLNSEPFDLVKMINDVTGLMSTIAEDKNLTFKQNITLPKSVLVEGDHVRLKQILFNLLSNSFKFTHEGEVILTVYEKSEGCFFFSVSDTGIGIPTELQSRIFNRFEQTENSCAENASKYGVGLGLSICKEFVSAMQGEITLFSVPNKGTTISFDILLSKSKKDTNTLNIEEKSSTLTILLVEDDIALAELISGFLKENGYTVKHAHHGLAALILLKQDKFDIAIINLDLPIMNGFTLAEKIRSDYLLPLIAITACVDYVNTQKQAESFGFSKLINTPITHQNLIDTIIEVI